MTRPPLATWDHCFIDVTSFTDRCATVAAYLESAVRPEESVIIFRHHGNKAVKTALQLRTLGYAAAPLVGRMSEADRRRTIDLFNAGEIRILVATEIVTSHHTNNGSSTNSGGGTGNYSSSSTSYLSTGGTAVRRINQADHIILHSFYYSSPGSNVRDYIASCTMGTGSGRVVSLVTIADSVTMQHIKTSVGCSLKELPLPEEALAEARQRYATEIEGKEGKVAREQDKLTQLLLTASAIPSSCSASSSPNSSLGGGGGAAPAASAAAAASSSSSVSAPRRAQSPPRLHLSRNNSNTQQQQEANIGAKMADINAVRATYEAIAAGVNVSGGSKAARGNNKTTATAMNNARRGISFDDDDPASSSSSSSDDDDDNSYEDRNEINNRRRCARLLASPPRPNASASAAADDSTSKSRSRSQPRSQSQPRRSSSSNNNNSNSSGARARRHDVHEHTVSPNYHPGSRGHTVSQVPASLLLNKNGNGNGNNNINAPNGNRAQNMAPYQPRSGDEEFSNMIHAEIVHETRTSFDDIAGQMEAKSVLEEAVVLPVLLPNFFNPASKLRRPPRGILLYGPPGTGKTLMARAVASEGGATFINVPISSVVSKWRGESEKFVRVLFDIARHYSPSLIFMDECDSICSQRGGSNEHEASRRLKSALLAEIDGLHTPTETVIFLGATNHPQDIDDAMRRRFEARVYVGLPDYRDRVEMLRLNLIGGGGSKSSQQHNVKLGDDVNLHTLSQKMEGRYYSGADIATLCREAVMRPVRRFLNNSGGDNSNSNKPEQQTDEERRAAMLRRRQLLQDPRKLEEQLASLPVTMSDFAEAMASVTSSVNAAQIQKYDAWRAQFSGGGGANAATGSPAATASAGANVVL